jgi:hypothetical protein
MTDGKIQDSELNETIHIIMISLTRYTESKNRYNSRVVMPRRYQ